MVAPPSKGELRSEFESEFAPAHRLTSPSTMVYAGVIGDGVLGVSRVEISSKALRVMEF